MLRKVKHLFFPPKGYKQRKKICNTRYGSGADLWHGGQRPTSAKCDLDLLNFCGTHQSVSVRNTSNDWVCVSPTKTRAREHVSLPEKEVGKSSYAPRQCKSDFVVCLDHSIVSSSCLLECWWFYNICYFSAKFRKTYRQNSGIQRGETLLRIIDKTMNAHQDSTFTWREDWEGVWRLKEVIHVKLEQSALSRGGGSWHQLSDTFNGVLWTAWAPFAPDGDLGQRHSRSLSR